MDAENIDALKSLLEREVASGGDEHRIRTIRALDFADMSSMAKQARANARGALEGDAPSQHDLSVHFEEGLGVKAEDQELSFYWSKLAAEQDFGPAQNNLANKYAKGRGTLFDGKEAIRLYRLSAEKKIPEALGNLGYCCLCGECLERDPVKAVELLNEAIRLSEPGRQSGRAHYNLARCYERGDGVRKDLDKAVGHYRKAVELGWEDAQTALRRLEA